jgi:hypothetical protein
MGLIEIYGFLAGCEKIHFQDMDLTIYILKTSSNYRVYI